MDVGNSAINERCLCWRMASGGTREIVAGRASATLKRTVTMRQSHNDSLSNHEWVQ